MKFLLQKIENRLAIKVLEFDSLSTPKIFEILIRSLSQSLSGDVFDGVPCGVTSSSVYFDLEIDSLNSAHFDNLSASPILDRF